ncbi:MAG: hypothetical protein KKF46_06335 [Nanoarchaeota archaeon]|nr:hypothetical protein [Nanoarchaeota archaeon]MBU1321948.1 hypothetical protein [Nanoarchaeota archaeon]MBU1597944.1 hypothetical protein [Nanoarchaeota archaeon]MBU2441181.1 hypothetical protein [Nanoarchaeota archaeon]
MTQNQEPDVFTIEETREATKDEINQYMAQQLDFLLEENIGKIGELKATDLSNKVKKELWKEYKNNIPNHIKPKEYQVEPANTYAKGVAKIKAMSQEPFTHEQNIEARVLDYKAKGDKSELFNTWLDSITGIAYRAQTTKFKIQPRCDKLREINPKFNESSLPIDYNSFQGVELDSNDPNVKYNQNLTREEAKAHPAHLAAMNNNKEVWEKMVDIWFDNDKTSRKKGMGFYVLQNTPKDQLRSAILSNDDLNSYACGDGSLYNDARFASRAQ